MSPDEIQEKRNRRLEAADNDTKVDPVWLAKSTDMMFDLNAAKEQINGMKENDLEKLASAAVKALKAVNGIRETIRVIIKEKNMTKYEVRGASSEMDLYSFVNTANGCAFPGTAYGSDDAEVDERSEEPEASFDKALDDGDDAKGIYLTKLDDADQKLGEMESTGKIPESSSKKETEDTLRNEQQKQDETSLRVKRLDQAKRQTSIKSSKFFSTPLPLLAVVDSLKQKKKESTLKLYGDQVFETKERVIVDANLIEDEETPSLTSHSSDQKGTDSQFRVSDTEGKLETGTGGENKIKNLLDHSQRVPQEQKKDLHLREVYENVNHHTIEGARQIGEAWISKLLVKNRMNTQDETSMQSKKSVALAEINVGKTTADNLNSQNEYSSTESSKAANRNAKV